MTIEQIKQTLQGSEWVSIAPEVRPSIIKNETGDLKPFYCTRHFIFPAGDRFELSFVNYADPNAKVPLVRMDIKGHLVFDGAHPIAEGAYNVNYIADEAYEVTPLHQGFADAANQTPGEGLAKWELNVTQDVKGKSFPAFGLLAGGAYVDYDLIYIAHDMLFNGSKNVDGRPFDQPANRPTNLQMPLVSRK